MTATEPSHEMEDFISLLALPYQYERNSINDTSEKSITMEDVDKNYILTI